METELKRLFLALLVPLALGLAACDSGQATTTAPATTDNAVSAEQKLLLGTLKLSGSQVITKDQAARLLPLWESIRDLNQGMAPGGDTDTQVQIDDLASQISSAMTPDQLKAIDAMNISGDTMVSMMRELGFVVGDRQGRLPAGDGGQAPQGAAPGGGQGRGPGGSLLRASRLRAARAGSRPAADKPAARCLPMASGPTGAAAAACSSAPSCTTR